MPRIRPIVQRFGPVSPGLGAAVGAGLQAVGQAVGQFAELKTNRELLDIRSQIQVDALQAKQVEKMERSEAIAQFTAKQIVRNEASSKIVADARQARNFEDVQRDMDAFEDDYNQNLFEGRSNQFQDIFESMDRSARVGQINKLGTAVEAGRLRIISDNYQISADNFVNSVNSFSDPAEIVEFFDTMEQMGVGMGFTRVAIESVAGQGRREAMEKFIRSLPLVNGLALLSDPDVASALGEDGREVMRRDLTTRANSLEANRVLVSRVTELVTGINILEQFNARVSESDLNTMIRNQEFVSPAAQKDALDLLGVLSRAREKGPQPISPDQLRSNHVFSEQSMEVILNKRKTLEDQDMSEDDRQEALLDLNRQGITILAEATQLAAQGQFNEDKLVDLTFEMTPLTEGLFIFEDEAKELGERLISSGRNLLLRLAIPGKMFSKIDIKSNKRIPNAIIADVRRDMFLGEGRYGELSPTQRAVMGRILTTEAILTNNSSQPMSGEDAMTLSEGVFERSAIRFMSDEFGLIGENAEQVRGIVFRDGPPATEPRQQPSQTTLADVIRRGFDLGMTEESIRIQAKGFAGFSDEAFDRALGAVDSATANALALEPLSEGR